MENENVEIVEPTEEQSKVPESKVETKVVETEDVKEQRREGYAQRKLKESETTVLSLNERLKEVETNYAISESLRKYNLSEDDIPLILDSDPTKISEKAEKLSQKYQALLEKKEAEVKEKIEKSSPNFGPKYKPVEGATNKEKAQNLGKQLFGS